MFSKAILVFTSVLWGVSAAAQEWQIVDVRTKNFHCLPGQVTADWVEFNADGSGTIKWERSYGGKLDTQATLWWEAPKFNPINGEIVFPLYAHHNYGRRPVAVTARVKSYDLGQALLTGAGQQASGSVRFTPRPSEGDEFDIDFWVSNCDDPLGSITMRRAGGSFSGAYNTRGNNDVSSATIVYEGNTTIVDRGNGRYTVTQTIDDLTMTGAGRVSPQGALVVQFTGYDVCAEYRTTTGGRLDGRWGVTCRAPWTGREELTPR